VRHLTDYTNPSTCHTSASRKFLPREASPGFLDQRGFTRAVIVSSIVEGKDEQAAGEKKVHKPWTLREFGGKTVWDWLQLLVVPHMLALITVVFTWQQNVSQNQLEDQRARQAQKIENQRAEAEALQAYLDQMSMLLLEKNLRDSEEESEVRTLARARTTGSVLARAVSVSLRSSFSNRHSR
jgi:hypothetical protein